MHLHSFFPFSLSLKWKKWQWHFFHFGAPSQLVLFPPSVSWTSFLFSKWPWFIQIPISWIVNFFVLLASSSEIFLLTSSSSFWNLTSSSNTSIFLSLSWSSLMKALSTLLSHFLIFHFFPQPTKSLILAHYITKTTLPVTTGLATLNPIST